MDGFYREMTEETAILPSLKREETLTRRYENRIRISETRLHSPEGLLYTVEMRDELFNNDRLQCESIKVLSEIIGKYLDNFGVIKGQPILVAGLGNEKVTADSFGGAVCDRLKVTSHLYSDRKISSKFGNLACIKCGVSGTTGISSFEILKSVTEKFRPAALIAVDSLACGSTSRLARTIQLSDRGIEPGGGVGNARPELTKKSLGVPILAIGVPFVMYVRRILAEFCPDSTVNITEPDLIVTGRDVDFQVNDFSHIVAESINNAVHAN